MSPHLQPFFTISLLAAIASADLAAQGPTWASPDLVPAARWYHAMAFDDGRGRAVLFGGRDLASNVFGDTWEWDGAAWIRRTPAHSPSARSDSAMAYDPVRGVTVLFGGTVAGAPNGETWEWDGADWTQRSPAVSPNANHGHAMAWHGGTNPGLLLYGGLTTNTWQWDGTTWSLRSSIGPGSSGCGMAYASSTQRTYLLISPANFNAAAQCWVWDGNVWAVAGPAFNNPPCNTKVVYDPDRNELLAVGGQVFNGLFLGNNVHVRVGQQLSPTSVVWGTGVQFPSGLVGGLWGSNSVYDTARRAVLTFGGRVDEFGGPALSNVLTEARSYGTSWSQRSPAIFTHPGPRVYTDMAFDPYYGRSILFGGYDGANLRNDAWTWNGAAWTNHGNSSVVSPRIQPALCNNPAWGTVLFGGGDFGSTFHNDAFVWSNTGFLPMPIVGALPPARRDHDLVHDSARDRLILYGGFNGGYLADTWELRYTPSGFQWTQLITINSPGPRNGHAMAYDARRGKVVMFGGSNQGVFDGTTWELTAGGPFGTDVWTQANPAQSPPRRWTHSMAYDPGRGVVVMTGGYGNPTCGNFCASHLNDVWEYDGATWTQRAADSPPSGREGAGLCYDGHRHRFVMHGGSGNSAYPTETWFYNAPVDRFGEGMAGGSTLKLRCLQFPIAGRSTRFEFPSPIGFGWIRIALETAPVPAVTLGPGLLCGTGSLYGVQAVLVDAMGNPGAVQFTLPASMLGLGFVAQGIAFDPAVCLRLTDPLAVTVHWE